MQNDEIYIRRCLFLAQRGKAVVSPNPMVGAVLVYQDRIIAEGYHHYFGGPHAEVDCINNVPADDEPLIPESTLYVSLEPCSHFGKTPPCANLIINKKIKRVVVACLDPNPLVAGKGLQLLKDAGIEVKMSKETDAARSLNKRFFTNQEKQRPYIILKWAQSADGFVSNFDQSPIQISNKATQVLNHQWRSEESAIAVGVNTVLKDNPSLTTRLVNGKNPIRVLFDPKSNLASKDFTIFNTEAPTIYNSSETDLKNWSAVMDYLWREKKISSIIVEGGPKTLQYFIDADLWDEVRIITNESLKIGNGYPAPRFLPGIMPSKEEIFGNCKVVYYERFH